MHRCRGTGQLRLKAITIVRRRTAMRSTFCRLLLATAFAVASVPLALPAAGATTCFGKKPTILGTRGDDEIEGTAGRDVIQGLGGDDEIRGLGGEDRICGD